MTEGFARAISSVAKELHDGLSHRIARCESELALLKGRTTRVKWAGVWHEGQRVCEGQLTTNAGSLWLALHDTTERPGKSSAYRLIVKSGRVPR